MGPFKPENYFFLEAFFLVAFFLVAAFFFVAFFLAAIVYLLLLLVRQSQLRFRCSRIHFFNRIILITRCDCSSKSISKAVSSANKKSEKKLFCFNSRRLSVRASITARGSASDFHASIRIHARAFCCVMRMSFFRLHSLSTLGAKASSVDIECVQARRLPYLHIIGTAPSAAAEQRERLLAALAASGFRLPARRITIRYSSALKEGLEGLDLAAALAILGSGAQFPPDRLREGWVMGALRLDGGVSPRQSAASCAEILALTEPHAPVLVPAEHDRLLEGRSRGAAVESLAQAVSYLRGGETLLRKASSSSAPEVLHHSPPCISSAPLRRGLELAAAGGLHLLVPGDPLPAAQAVAALLPPGTTDAMEESRLYFSQSGASCGPWPPLRRVSAAQATRLFRFDARSGLCGELSLAHEGVLALELARKPGRLLDSLKECMEEGSIRAYHQGRFYALRTNVLVVASAATCGSGGCTWPAGPHCQCDSVRRLAIAADEREALPFFDLVLPPVESGCEGWPEWARSRARVAAARARALHRQGCPNGRLPLAKMDSVVPWSEGGAAIARSCAGARLRSLRRLALTICDIRMAEENAKGSDPGMVSRDDALEARHYLGSASGISLPSSSAPAVNSTAMP